MPLCALKPSDSIIGLSGFCCYGYLLITGVFVPGKSIFFTVILFGVYSSATIISLLTCICLWSWIPPSHSVISRMRLPGILIRIFII